MTIQEINVQDGVPGADVQGSMHGPLTNVESACMSDFKHRRVVRLHTNHVYPDDLWLELENGHSRPPCVQQFRVPLRMWDNVNEHINSL